MPNQLLGQLIGKLTKGAQIVKIKRIGYFVVDSAFPTKGPKRGRKRLGRPPKNK